jgi:hypothetical protein
VPAGPKAVREVEDITIDDGQRLMVWPDGMTAELIFLGSHWVIAPA